MIAARCLRPTRYSGPSRPRTPTSRAGRSSLRRLASYLSFTFLSLPLVLFGRRPDMLFVESQPLSLGLVGVLIDARRSGLLPDAFQVVELLRTEAGFWISDSLAKLIIDS